MTRNSANENPNLGQQLKDLGNQIQNFGLNIDNNNQILMNMQMQMNPMMMNPNPEIWTLEFEHTRLGMYPINISPKKFVRDAIDLFKSKANIDDISKMHFIFNGSKLHPELEIGKSGLKHLSRIVAVESNIIQ